MRLLDLFCGAGGAAMGYHRAGFDEIVGVDIKPQPRYPFRFVQADALEFVKSFGAGFDAIHASPPCQAYSAMKTMPRSREKQHPELVAPTRTILQAINRPYVIENVEGAPMKPQMRLCGTMFGLSSSDGLADLRRHRLFECPWFFGLIPPCNHDGYSSAIGVYGGGQHLGRRRKRPATVGVDGNGGGSSTRYGTSQFGISERAHAMGIDWMRSHELNQAIPPAYTEYIGKQLLQHLGETR